MEKIASLPKSGKQLQKITSGRLVAVNARGDRIGQDHHRAKFSNRDIELVFEFREMGWGYRKIAAKMEISVRHVKRIIKGLQRQLTPSRYKRIA